MRHAARLARDRGHGAIAVAFLFSYKNPAHELRAREIVLDELGEDFTVSLSHEAAKEWREYERTSSAVVESYTDPIVRRYLNKLEVRLREDGLADPARALRLAAEYGGRPDDPAKDDPLDVAVWQGAEPGHPGWDSPWGPGRPGWHAECAAMALSVFGAGVDIHAGGADLRFPHHAYHAAMVEAVTGVRPYARASLHAGTVTVGGVKMAKSAGNLVLLRDLLAEHPAAAIRLLILDRPWADDWDYSTAALAAATRRLEQLHRAAGRTAVSGRAVITELRRLLTTT